MLVYALLDLARKNPHAVALGRRGGKKGGPARAKKLSAKDRVRIAQQAARARWGKPKRDPKVTSRIMSAVRSRDTGPELRLRHALHAAGCRFRVDYRAVPGRPDIAFPRHKVAVFVDGDYWHGNVGRARGLSEVAEDMEPYGRWANADFWSKKITANVERDRRVDKELSERGWAVIRLWESDLAADLEAGVGRVLKVVGRSK